jgi:glycyl-tRNA synthetase
MHPLYNVNGLVHWTQREIEQRERLIGFFAGEVQAFLLGENPAWSAIERIEAPTMMPRKLVNPNYSDDDLWAFQPHDEHEGALVARPETTASTYMWMVYQLQNHSGKRLPYACWQAGKSFRAETDHVLKHMRLKEFYQQEFQCAYSAETANDYQEKCLEPMRRAIALATGRPARIVESDRLPSYSLRTMDIEVGMGDRWMELCSISKRTDFPIRNRFQNKKKEWIETDVHVLEIAIGLDRAIAAWNYAGTLDQKVVEDSRACPLCGVERSPLSRCATDRCPTPWGLTIDQDRIVT